MKTVTKKKLMTLCFAGMLVLTAACGETPQENVTDSAASGSSVVTAEGTEDPATEQNSTEASSGEEQDTQFSLENTSGAKLDIENAADPAAFSGEGMKIAFTTDIDFDEEITGADMASMAIYNNMDKIGADETVILQYANTRPTETGVTYYTFNQVNNYVRVYGSSLKLIVDKNGKAIGLVSAIVPNLKTPEVGEADISVEDAEAVVKTRFKKEGINVISGASEEVLLPVEEGSNRMYYAWVVYSREAGNKYDTGYLAHYVSKSGVYLYNMPVSEPGTVEALSGDIAVFAFDGGTPGTLSTTIKYSDGHTVDVELPMMYDGETGEAVLADPERKILCADYADYMNENTLTPVKCGENDELVNSQLMNYYHFILIYDFYNEIGWTGPDGEGTPSLLLMNMVDEEGNPVDNAFYSGKGRGFQIFQLSDIYDHGESLDIMGHEFTHCFTSTTMTTNLYKNDAGAINEGMSDILGNLIRIMINGYTDDAWLIGDPTDINRSMKNPHEYKQPEYAGDLYYVPGVSRSTDTNDSGGVHINSSLLNLVSWHLDQAGMDPSDQIYFWMNVALTITPKTDYPQMAELLPWVMETSGFPEYVTAVEEIIADTRMALGEDPENVPDGCGKVRFNYCFNELQNYDVNVDFSDENGETVLNSWPSGETNWVSAVVPEGDYLITLTFTPVVNEDDEEDSSGTVYALYTTDGWYLLSEDDLISVYNTYASDYLIHIEAGKVTTLETDSLKQAIEE